MSNLAILQKDITEQINTKVATLQNEGLALPANYNYSNALKSAFFKLQTVTDRNKQGALQVCTTSSIANTLLDMVVQGLTPAKNQCYFIVYGNELQMQRSYFGTQAVLKRLSGVNDIWANIIFEGDEFEMEIDEEGRERLVKHKTSFLNRDNEILGAYAIIDTEKDGQMLTVMTKKEIKTSWSKAKSSGVQNQFPQEMAKRTVINRAAKNYINTSNDSDLLVDAINGTTANESDYEREDVTESTTETTVDLLAEFEEIKENTPDTPIEVIEEAPQDPFPIENNAPEMIEAEIIEVEETVVNDNAKANRIKPE